MGGCGLSIMFTSLLPIHLDHVYLQPVGAVSLADYVFAIMCCTADQDKVRNLRMCCTEDLLSTNDKHGPFEHLLTGADALCAQCIVAVEWCGLFQHYTSGFVFMSSVVSSLIEFDTRGRVSFPLRSRF